MSVFQWWVSTSSIQLYSKGFVPVGKCPKGYSLTEYWGMNYGLIFATHGHF